jgi:hypothetical protein
MIVTLPGIACCRYEYIRLDGTTSRKDRQALSDQFNNGRSYRVGKFLLLPSPPCVMPAISALDAQQLWI